MTDITKNKHLRWMPGMLTRSGYRVVNVNRFGVHTIHPQSQYRLYIWTHEDVPCDFDTLDLTDPATLGCLLQLVREAHGQPTAYVDVRGGRACVFATEGMGEGKIGLTGWWIGGEAEALVAALKDAP